MKMYNRLSSLLHQRAKAKDRRLDSLRYKITYDPVANAPGTVFILISATNKLDLRYKSQTNELIDQRRPRVMRGFKPALIVFIIFATFALAVADRLVGTRGVNFATRAAPDAASLFNGQCAKCHGRDGRAKTTRGRQTQTRDITSAEWQNDVSDERIFNSISRGKGKMPAFKKLSDAQIDSLVSYVRRLRK